MIEEVALVLLPGLAVAANPIPVIASFRMAAVDRGITLALVFAAGWMLGLALESYVVLLVVDGFLGSGTTSWAWLHLVLAVVMAGLAVRLWRRRFAEAAGQVPVWLDEVAGFTVPRTLGVAVALSAVNPRVLVFTLAAMSALVQQGASAAGLVWFVALGSIGVVFPVARAGVGTHDREDDPSRWWVEHNIVVAATVLVLMAATQLAAAALAA